jgi:hypothetical protein
MFVPLAPAALPKAGVWRNVWGDGAHGPSTARHAAFNDQIFAESLSKISNLEKSAMG